MNITYNNDYTEETNEYETIKERLFSYFESSFEEYQNRKDKINIQIDLIKLDLYCISEDFYKIKQKSNENHLNFSKRNTFTPHKKSIYNLNFNSVLDRKSVFSKKGQSNKETYCLTSNGKSEKSTINKAFTHRKTTTFPNNTFELIQRNKTPYKKSKLSSID